jgi:hypothetical protein
MATLVAERARGKGKTARKIKGAVLWRGVSPWDGSPVVAIVSGVNGESANVKTGPMSHVWILPADELPSSAVKAGRDGGVCGTCPMRAALRRLLDDLFPEEGPRPACYVRTNAAPDQVWRSWQAGTYLDAHADGLAFRAAAQALVSGSSEGLRWGAYGDPGFLPLELLRMLTRRVRSARKSVTGYTHQWQHISTDYRKYLMASVGSEEEREQAKRNGWRTFRVRRPGESILPGERTCPASDEYAAAHGGHKVSCADCGACHGTGANDTQGMADVVILDHGPTSRSTQDKQAAGRIALRMI